MSPTVPGRLPGFPGGSEAGAGRGRYCAEALAHYMVTTVTGMKTLVKAGLPAATVNEIAEVALGALR